VTTLSMSILSLAVCFSYGLTWFYVHQTLLKILMTLAVPSSPVIQLATALGARERGETGGTSAAELFGLADNTLSDAIAIDASQHPEETIWYS